MHNAVLVQKVNSGHDLSKDAARLHLGHSLSLVEVVVQLAATSVLHHQYDLLGALVDFFEIKIEKILDHDIKTKKDFESAKRLGYLIPNICYDVIVKKIT